MISHNYHGTQRLLYEERQIFTSERESAGDAKKSFVRVFPESILGRLFPMQEEELKEEMGFWKCLI